MRTGFPFNVDGEIMTHAGTNNVIFLYANEPHKPQVPTDKIVRQVIFGRWSQIIEVVPLDIAQKTIGDLALAIGGLEGAALCTTKAWEKYNQNDPNFLADIADSYETTGRLLPGQAYMLKITDQAKFVEYINNAKVH
jgi:hypothetical protein